MQVSRFTDIKASRQVVWDVVSDIENAASTIQGIHRIEVLEPAGGSSIVGLKWREFRSWKGQEAVEVMWITEAEKPSYYVTRAESHGAVYSSRISLQPNATGTHLTMSFTAQPVTFAARILWVLTGWMAKRALAKTIDQDIADIKAKVEGVA